MCICTFFFAGVQTKKNMVSVAIQCTLLTDVIRPESTPDVPCEIESEIDEEQDDDDDDDYVVEYGSSSEDELEAIQPNDRLVTPTWNVFDVHKISYAIIVSFCMYMWPATMQ